MVYRDLVIQGARVDRRVDSAMLRIGWESALYIPARPSFSMRLRRFTAPIKIQHRNSLAH